MGGASLVIGALDYGYQRFEWERGLRMSRDEIKEESRAAEGDPALRAKIRSTQKDMARRRMMAAVPKADVIIANPTHFAVALRYDERRMRAPLVVAKGADVIAARSVKSPPKAGADFRGAAAGTCTVSKRRDRRRDSGDSLRAVAQVLTYIYQLKTARSTGIDAPEPPQIDPSIDAMKH